MAQMLKCWSRRSSLDTTHCPLSVEAFRSYLHSKENVTAVEAVAHSNTVLGAQLDTGSAVRDTQRQGPEDGYGLGYFYRARRSRWTYMVDLSARVEESHKQDRHGCSRSRASHLSGDLHGTRP